MGVDVKRRRYLIPLILIIGTLAIVTLFQLKTANNQYWLNQTVIKMTLVNRISEFSIEVKDSNQLSEILSLLKRISFINRKPEETYGLGYSVILRYDNLKVEYYFATPEHMYITINADPFKEFLIDKQIGQQIYDLIQKLTS